MPFPPQEAVVKLMVHTTLSVILDVEQSITGIR